MKISKAALVGLIALSIMGLSACDASSININGDSTSVSSADAGSAAANEKKSAESGAEVGENVTSGGESNTADSEQSAASKTDKTENSSDNVSSKDHTYSEVIDPPAAGISIAALEGNWIDMGIGTEILYITAGSDIYHGNFSFRDDEGKITTGTIKLEQDSSGVTVYSFYEDNGSIWNVFAADGEIPVDKLISVEGDRDFQRQSEDQMADNVTSIEVYEGTYVEETAGRGVITLTVDASKRCWFHVRWPSSASEVAEWDFNCYYDDNGGFPYENGVKTVTTYDEDGNETVTEENTKCAGCIIVDQAQDGTYAFRWNEENEKIADGCVFVKQ